MSLFTAVRHLYTVRNAFNLLWVKFNFRIFLKHSVNGNYDFDHAEVARLLFDSESLAAAKLKAEITENIKEYADGKIKAVITDEKIGAKYGMGKEDIPNLVDIPRRIEGTEIAVCIKRTNNGFRLNLRSNGKADVAEVAMKFGGGGHIKAAGATLDFDSTEKAERAVIDACKRALDKII